MTRDVVFYGGAKYYLQSCGRYYSTRHRVDGERLLHRRIWVNHHGPIPKGFHIHHKDHDWRNNEISNLECMRGKLHHSHHMEERHAAGVGNAEALVQARVKAAEWHASAAGLEWHSEHGRRTWENRKPLGAKCVKCGSPYWTYFPDRASFCSQSCLNASAYRRAFTDVCSCEFCGKTFTRNKYRKAQVCCSLACANRKRAADQRSG